MWLLPLLFVEFAFARSELEVKVIQDGLKLMVRVVFCCRFVTREFRVAYLFLG